MTKERKVKLEEGSMLGLDNNECAKVKGAKRREEKKDEKIKEKI